MGDKVQNQRGRSLIGSLGTLAVGAIALFFCAPAVITAVFSQVPQSTLGRLPGGLWFLNFVNLCWIAVVIGGGVYLFLALVLNIFLLFRRQAPVWLMALVWVVFAVGVLGEIRVQTELKHFHGF